MDMLNRLASTGEGRGGRREGTEGWSKWGGRGKSDYLRLSCSKDV